MMDYYKYLGIPTTATAEEITSAYLHKRAELQSSEADEQELDEQLRLLDKAYEDLIDTEQNTDAAQTSPETTERTALALRDKTSDLALAQASLARPQRPCQHCGEPNPVQATMCKKCGEQISRPCPACGQIVALTEEVCPRCDTVIVEYDQRRFVEAEVVHKKVQDERRASRTRVDALEAIHRINARRGVIFWLIVVTLCISLTIITTFLYNYFSQIYH